MDLSPDMEGSPNLSLGSAAKIKIALKRKLKKKVMNESDSEEEK